MQRDMTYDLDGVFASRNQGQLISTVAAQQQITRTPGLVPVRRTLAGYEVTGSYQGSMGSWFDESTTLPVLGSVSNKMIVIGALGVAAAAFFLLKKKK